MSRMCTQGWLLGSVYSLGRKVCDHTQSGDLVWDSLRDLKWADTGWVGSGQQPGHGPPLNVSLRSIGSSLYLLSFFFLSLPKGVAPQGVGCALWEP